MRDVVILGSTGSVGTQALDIVRANRDQFQIVGLAAGGAAPALLAEQAAEFNVRALAVANPGCEDALRSALEVLSITGQTSALD